MNAPFSRSRLVAVFLGGALGDAVGAPLEFADSPEIERRFGIELFSTKFQFDNGQITDDTQMTLWVAEGLVRAHQRKLTQGIPSVEVAVRDALLRWYVTQEPGEKKNLRVADSGCLLDVEKLRGKRSPDNQNLSSLGDLLHRKGWRTTPAELSVSQSPGALMRSAPYIVFTDVEECYEYAIRGALITHQDPVSTLAAGFYAALLHGLIRDLPWQESFARAFALAKTENCSNEKVAEIAALGEGVSSRPNVTELGGGWTAMSALRIAIHVFLASQKPEAEDIRTTLFLGAAHSGKSDTVAALVGQMLGASCGFGALPAEWLERLELRGLIESIASDLFDAWIVRSQHELARYPVG
jgi:ADP-ribosylglycohydrolase